MVAAGGSFTLLTKLSFYGLGIDLNTLSFHTYFPNLVKLRISKQKLDLPLDFISTLSKLAQLKSLTFENVVRLTNEHFTSLQESAEVTLAGGVVAAASGNLEPRYPAIACIKSLRHIHIVNCISLTDSCLIDGFVHCDNLEKITLCNLKGQFSEGALNSYQQLKNYYIEVEPRTHAEKHQDEPKEGYEYIRFVTKIKN